MGRPLGPSGGRDPGGGGTGLPDGLSGGRAAGRARSGTVSDGADAAAGDWAAGAGAAGEGAVAGGAAVAGAAGGGAAAAGAGAGRAAGGACAGRAATGACAGAEGAAGGGVGRLLLIRRDERAGASVPAPDPADVGAAAGAAGAAGAAEAAGADSGRAGAFLTGALLAAELLDTEVSGRRVSTPAPPSSVPSAGPADFAALVALAAFFAGAGSSGWTGRRNPSASALRRTRSACASSMEDEWLLTPIPRERARSSPSLLLRPSSLASS